MCTKLGDNDKMNYILFQSKKRSHNNKNKINYIKKKKIKQKNIKTERNKIHKLFLQKAKKIK